MTRNALYPYVPLANSLCKSFLFEQLLSYVVAELGVHIYWRISFPASLRGQRRRWREEDEKRKIKSRMGGSSRGEGVISQTEIGGHRVKEASTTRRRPIKMATIDPLRGALLLRNLPFYEVNL